MESGLELLIVKADHINIPLGEDIESCISHVKANIHLGNAKNAGGWARLAVRIARRVVIA